MEGDGHWTHVERDPLSDDEERGYSAVMVVGVH